MPRRNVEVAVISDVHLGTYGCHAAEVLHYLRKIQPRLLVLNGDIFDMWNFSRRYFPLAHFEVIRQIIGMSVNGTRVVYITGNHDDVMRRYSDMKIGNLQLCDKLVIEIDGKMCWFFHGDVFDATTKGSAKILARLGGKGYDLLILLNRFINRILTAMGRPKMSLSKRIKQGVKKAVSWIDNFEETAAELAIENGYDYVICGHIHQPQKREVAHNGKSVIYLNSGDWVENLTALEYYDGDWHLYYYQEETTPAIIADQDEQQLISRVIPEAVMMYMQRSGKIISA